MNAPPTMNQTHALRRADSTRVLPDIRGIIHPADASAVLGSLPRLPEPALITLRCSALGRATPLGAKGVKTARAMGTGPMQIVFLGTSGSWPTPKRNVSAIAVKRGPEVLLFDCGEGTQRQFMASKLSFMQVSRVFLTHFHGDHFLGLPGLIQSMNFFGREAPLEVYGPAGAEALVAQLLSLGHFKAAYPVAARDLAPGERVDCGEYAVSAFEAVHTVPGLGYVLEEKERPGRFDLEKAKTLGIPPGPLYSRLQEGE